MSDDLRLSRGIRDWLEDGPTVAPVAVLEAALFEIATTPQAGSLRLPWRPLALPRRTRLAAALLAAIAVIAGTQYAFQGNQAPATPPSATASTPSASVQPSATAATPASSFAALTETFTSRRYGYVMRVAPGWSVQQAALTWSGFDNSGPVLDRIDTHGIGAPALIITAASEPLAPVSSLAEWLDRFQAPSLASSDCLGGPASGWPVRQVGQYAWTWRQGCHAASAITVATGRVYVFDCVGCVEADHVDDAAFEAIIASVRLEPASAAPLPSAPSLDRAFASHRNGFSVRYPAAWSFVRRATATASFITLLEPSDAAADALGSGAVQLSVASLPLGQGMSAQDWAAHFCPMTWTQWSGSCPGTTTWEAVSIDGMPGWITINGDAAGSYPTSQARLFVATVVAGGRAYEIRLDGAVERSLFLAILDSMRLDPAAASAATPAP